MTILTACPAGDNSGRSRINTRYATSTEVARLCGVSFITVNRACNAGDIEHSKTSGGHRRVDIKSACEFFGTPVPASYVAQGDEIETGKVVAIYGRVSTSKQGDNLKRQVERLQTYVAANYPGQDFKTFQEIGSGINNERPQLLKLLDYILAGRVSVVVCEYGDRLSRSARSLIVRICEKCGVSVVETRQGDKESKALTEHEEMVEDVTMYMNVFSAKTNGRRGGEKVKFVASPELKTRIAMLHAEGKSTRKIGEIVIAEGHRCLNTNKVVGIWSVNNIMAEIKAGLATGKTTGTAPQSVTKFIKRYCLTGKGKRVYGAAFYQTYTAFCKREGLEVLNRQILANALRSMGYESNREGTGANLITGLSLKHNSKASHRRKGWKVILPD